MATPAESLIRGQLMSRRHLLEEAADAAVDPDLTRLLGEVDAALARLDDGSYGLCRTCHDPIESDRLMADPLLEFCIDHLTSDQRRALEADLGLASRIQGALLPDRAVRANGWEIAYHYEGAGPVSGDYCDIVRADGDGLYFAVGDVSGKGVAASMLMAHLHATLRGLVSLRVPLDQLVERTSRAFCESTLPTHYATLVCGRADPSGGIEICNAGHPEPVLLNNGAIRWIESTGLPIGMFADERFRMKQVALSPGDVLVLYSDGLSEARNGAEEEYGRDRLAELLRRAGRAPAQEILTACTSDLRAFRGAAPKGDDLTIMAIRRAE